MIRSLSTTFAGFCFLTGTLLGLFGRDLTLVQPVTADHLTRTDLDKLYQKLATNDSSLGNGSTRLSEIAQLTTQSVVHIQAQRQVERQGKVDETGSGVIMSNPRVSQFFVVTNRHVVADAGLYDISIHLNDGRVLHPVDVKADRQSDVAVLMLAETDLRPARWADSDTVNIGHMVLAMGSPFGLSQTITFGIISAKGRRSLKLGDSNDVINQDFLQTDAAINPGNSGGPLIDMHGRVVGINTAIASNSGGNEGIGFSIPSNLVRYVVDQLLENGYVPRAYLGVKLDPGFSYDDARRLKLDRLRGAHVLEVYADTPADRSSLKVNDVILKFAGVEVLDENHLINLVSLARINERVPVEILRNGRVTQLIVLLEDRSDLERRGQNNRPAPPQRPAQSRRFP